MAADSADIPLRVWVLKGGLIGAALACMGYVGVVFFIYIFSDLFDPKLVLSLTDFAELAIYFFLFSCIPALPTALLVGLAHRGLCRLFPREHKSIFAATLVGTSVICFLPVLVHLIPLKNLPIYDLTGLIVFFGVVPSLAAVVATTVVLWRSRQDTVGAIVP